MCLHDVIANDTYTWYFVWEEIRCCSGKDNKHFITLVSMHIVIIALVGCIFTRLRLVKIPCPLVQWRTPPTEE